MKFSVACNFDDALIDGLAPYPVYEVFGKLTEDAFGGGRPSFYLPSVDRKRLEDYVARTHRQGVEFNYLLNASAMDNIEYTRKGQREMDALLDWIDGIGVDAVTVANIYLLKLIKNRHPRLKVRISSHRFTNNARKVRFWQENGADCIAVNEVSVHREFDILQAMQDAAQDVDLQLIVNNWCRYDCAIAGNHAVTLSSASQKGSKGFPLDYCSLRCNQIRLDDPVNYIRANWIRPEDLHLYEAMGFNNFKIVERNTPTPILLKRIKAYSERKYDGNLLDLVQNYAYSEESFGDKAADAYSYRRLVRYFAKPRSINLLKFPKIMKFGRRSSMLYPLKGANPVQIDNRALDGFMERFKTKGCQDVDCDTCLYCHRWADKSVKVDTSFKEDMSEIYEDLLEEVDSGAMWEPYTKTIKNYGKKALGMTS
jgi:collagenase-like PrtC family protease